jgi:adenine deaminase
MAEATVPTAASLDEVRRAVDVAAGRAAGTLLLRNARLLNVFTGEIDEVHVLLAGRLIAAVGPELAEAEAERVVDLAGAWLAPGLIDGHVHIESSLVTAAAYAEGVLPRGVTGVVCDPHEIGNVAGVAGIAWLLDHTEEFPFDVFVTAPSCVPSTPMETSGAVLGLSEIGELLEHPRVVGVAEIMSFPAVIAGDDENLSKVLLAEAWRKTPEGHAPSVTGRDLQAYLASGIASDHEATTFEEGLEKLRAGVFLMVREGSVTRNLEALMPLVTPKHGDRIGFVTDDRLPHDLLDEGGVDCLVRGAIAAGVEPTYAVRCASFNVARHYNLPRRGAVAPGYLADLLVLDDLDTFRAAAVYKEGRRVAEGGVLSAPLPRTEVDAAPVRETVTLPLLTEASFRLDDPGGPVRCIEPVPYQVLTRSAVVTPTVRAGAVVADPQRDLLKLACVERYGKGGGIGVGLVSGFGLTRGALASTVGHDHHNLMAVAADDGDLVIACRRLEELGGGFVVAAGGAVLAELPLPLAGLITDEPLAAVRERLDALEAAATDLGNRLPAPFMTLSFLGLAVIPELRLTDMGLIDVFASALVPFGVDAP